MCEHPLATQHLQRRSAGLGKAYHHIFKEKRLFLSCLECLTPRLPSLLPLYPGHYVSVSFSYITTTESPIVWEQSSLLRLCFMSDRQFDPLGLCMSSGDICGLMVNFSQLWQRQLGTKPCSIALSCSSIPGQRAVDIWAPSGMLPLQLHYQIKAPPWWRELKVAQP